MLYSKILGTGSYLPIQRRTNADLEKMVDTTNEWIVTRTGIQERRIASELETTSVMAFEAAQKALEMSEIRADELDLIIVATCSGSYRFPSVACDVQAKLLAQSAPESDQPIDLKALSKEPLKNSRQCAAFDVSAACSGFIYALSIADQFIKAGTVKKALIIGSERMSEQCHPEDRSTIILFGDGAGAVVLSAEESEARTPSSSAILSTHLHSNGRYFELLKSGFHSNTARPIPQSTAYEQLPLAERIAREGWLQMTGNEVFKVAVTQLANVVEETLAFNGIDRSELDWLVPHQANLRIITATAKKLNMPIDNVVITLDRHGNTSAASVPIALDEGVRDGRIKRGQLLLLEAFGGGFTWGSALVRF